MTIGIQGQKFSYHEQAALQLFGEDAHLKYRQSFADLFECLEAGEVDVAVCAVENTIYGGISDVYDLLAKHTSIWIGGEIRLAIAHCLAGIHGADLKVITDIYSHPAALGQCKKFLRETLPNAKHHDWHDTAAAAQLVAKSADSTRAVICSEAAAKAHDLKILQKNIADNAKNATRFLILFPTAQSHEHANKTSIMLDLVHQPGALYDTLGTFKQAALNLSMIISRPIPEHPWRYRFFLDVDAGLNEPHLQLAIQSLKRQKIHLHICGSYKATNNNV